VPIAKFRKYEVSDSMIIRDFHSLLRAAILGARVVGRLKILINEQNLPKVMSKMPVADWKQWAMSRPAWMREEVEIAFGNFV
jgi:hypothetical protein